MQSPQLGILWAFVAAASGAVVILLALGIAVVVYQKRFVRMHRSYADGLVAAQEKERAWVAREVHDDALQRIKLMIQEVDDWEGAHGHGPPIGERSQALRGELEDLSASLRQMAYRLHPSFLRQEGIVSMLQRLAVELSQAGLRVDVVSSGEEPVLTDEQSLTAYRITQEALNNVMKHAACQAAQVALACDKGVLDLVVEDYGSGFDMLRVKRSGLGLTSMTERARSAGGMLSVDSHPGGGTRVHLRLPTASRA